MAVFDQEAAGAAHLPRWEGRWSLSSRTAGDFAPKCQQEAARRGILLDDLADALLWLDHPADVAD